jgi:hypothetical protein
VAIKQSQVCDPEAGRYDLAGVHADAEVELFFGDTQGREICCENRLMLERILV